jgi:hypothetical protein
VKIADVERLALALPEATEEPHFDMRSFRVRGKIFATVPPDGGVMHVFVDEAEARAAAAQDPATFSELWWGKRLSGLRVKVGAAKKIQMGELLEEAWRRKAPKRLVAALDERR